MPEKDQEKEKGKEPEGTVAVREQAQGKEKGKEPEGTVAVREQAQGKETAEATVPAQVLPAGKPPSNRSAQAEAPAAAK